MRLLTTIFILIFIYSCNDIKLHDEQKVLDNNLLIGEWQLDSSSSRFFSYDRLIILEDSSVYLFSGIDGGSLLTKGRRLGKDSFITELYRNSKVCLIDSNHFKLSGGWTDKENFYKRKKSGDFHYNLKQYLQQDTIRRKILGWWKLVSNQMPIKIINYNGYLEKFTLNIREDGSAVFYLANRLDSTVGYTYNVNVDGINFSRGCMGWSDCKISFDFKGRMKLLLENTMGDTLLLERVTYIK